MSDMGIDRVNHDQQTNQEIGVVWTCDDVANIKVGDIVPELILANNRLTKSEVAAAEEDAVDIKVDKRYDTLVSQIVMPGAYEQYSGGRKRYLVTETGKHGGICNIYKAKDILTGNDVALKILKKKFWDDDEMLMSVELEAKLMQKVSERSRKLRQALEVIDIIRLPPNSDKSIPIMVSNYVNSPTLRDTLQSETFKDPKVVFESLMTLAVIIDTIHQIQLTDVRGEVTPVVHRDITPANVLVSPEGMTLIDFGLSKFSYKGDPDAMKGTPAYASPEQLANGDASPGTDIYAFGCIAYELLTGKLPFQVLTPLMTAVEKLNGNIIPIKEIRCGESSQMTIDKLNAIFDIVLDRRPDDRILTSEWIWRRKHFDANDSRQIIAMDIAMAVGRVILPEGEAERILREDQDRQNELIVTKTKNKSS